jgi:hypothetical protein
LIKIADAYLAGELPAQHTERTGRAEHAQARGCGEIRRGSLFGCLLHVHPCSDGTLADAEGHRWGQVLGERRSRRSESAAGLAERGDPAAQEPASQRCR